MEAKKYYIRVEYRGSVVEGFFTPKEFLKSFEESTTVEEVINFWTEVGDDILEIELKIAKLLSYKDKRNYKYSVYEAEKYLKEIELEKHGK